MHAIARIAALIFAVVALTGCASKFRSYDGPDVTEVHVYKSFRRMYLLNGSNVLKMYYVNLGFAPSGDKLQEGDGRTPEGSYFINRRNPESEYHLSIGISYPDEVDVAEAAAVGRSPGGDIFIHGWGPKVTNPRPDWTYGCIAVTNKEIEEIYAMVRDGTRITIFP